MSPEKFNELLLMCQNCENQELVDQVVEQVAQLGPYEICDFAEAVKLVDTPRNMLLLAKGMLRSGDIVHIYEFMFLMVDCGRENFDLKWFEEIIKKSGNAKLMCYCLGFVPGINQLEMLNVLYATKHPKYIERLQDEEYDLDVNSLPGYYENLEEAKAFDYFPPCLEQFGTRDIRVLMPLVLRTRSPYLINELADYMEYLRDYKGVQGIDITPLQNAELEVGDPLHLYEFAASVESANKSAFQSEVVSRGMVKYMYYMYAYVTGVNQEDLRYAIKQTGDEKYTSKINLVR